MLKVIAKKGKKYEDSKITVNESTDIRKELYINSNEYIEFFPDFIFVIEKREDTAYVESIINVLRNFKTDDLEMEDFQLSLYDKVKINYSSLSFEQFVNAILYVITPEEELQDIVEEIKKIGYQEEADEIEDLDEPEVKLLRFKASFGKIFDNPNLQEIYDKIKLNPEFILAKTLYGNEQEYLKDLITDNQQKAIDVFIFSEHSSQKTEKVLTKGVINLLYYKSFLNITIKISDTGFVSLKIEPKKLYVDSDLKLIKNQVSKIYYTLTEKNNIQVSLSSFEIKITYPKRLGYFTKQIVALAENSEVKNDKVEYEINGRKCWFSQKEEKFNFTIKDIQTIEDVKNTAEKVNKRVEYYLENLGKFTSYKKDEMGRLILNVKHGLKLNEKKKIKIYNTNFDGVYDLEYTEKMLIFKPNKTSGLSKEGNFIFIGNVKKTSISELRKAGLIIDSKECQKDRRPELLLKNDPSTGEDIMELKGRKFRCNSPYIYHGVINKVNCCYKKKQENTQQKVKKNPLKLFTKVKKGSTKILEGTITDYLSSEYIMYSVADSNEERTIKSCLDYVFGEENIETFINEIDSTTFLNYFKDTDLETWRNFQEKSITDIIKVISLYTNTTILLLLDNLINGLSIECQDTPYFDKYVLIYRSNEKIQSFYPIIAGDTKIHFEKDIKDLVEISKNVCKSGFYKTISNYKDIVVSQITDYQNMVIFIQINSGGYIPISPSTPTELTEVIPISSSNFKLLYPESQYKSLLNQVQKYPELLPIGVTKILNTDIITGIKLQNGGIVPVTHSIWESSPLSTVEDLFYIEKYYKEGEDFSNNDEVFLKNIEKVKDIENIKLYIQMEDYTKLIEVITPITNDLDEITRLIWFMINN